MLHVLGTIVFFLLFYLSLQKWGKILTFFFFSEIGKKNEYEGGFCRLENRNWATGPRLFEEMSACEKC